MLTKGLFTIFEDQKYHLFAQNQPKPSKKSRSFNPLMKTLAEDFG